MPLALRGLADRARLAQYSDRILQTPFPDRVVGFPFELLRSFRCLISGALRHHGLRPPDFRAWSGCTARPSPLRTSDRFSDDHTGRARQRRLFDLLPSGLSEPCVGFLLAIGLALAGDDEEF